MPQWNQLWSLLLGSAALVYASLEEEKPSAWLTRGPWQCVWLVCSVGVESLASPWSAGRQGHQCSVPGGPAHRGMELTTRVTLLMLLDCVASLRAMMLHHRNREWCTRESPVTVASSSHCQAEAQSRP